MANFKNTTINDTGTLNLPSGSTGQRPGSPVIGQIRYNTTLSKYEIYNGITGTGDGTGWNDLVGAAGSLTEKIVQPRAILKLRQTSADTISVGGSQITLNSWTPEIEAYNEGVISYADDRITFLKSGLYKVHAHISFYQSASDETEYRNNPQVALYLNGSTKFPGAGQQTYIRNGYNHRYSSGITEIVYEFSAGDFVQVRCRTEADRNSGKTGSVVTAVGQGFPGVFFAEEVPDLQFSTKNNGSDTNINRSITTSWSSIYNSNGTAVSSLSNSEFRVNESGFYRAVASLESRGGISEGGARQTAVLRFTNNGSSGRARTAHGYQRTDGLETGLFIMDIFNLASGQDIDLRSQQDSNGGNWTVDYSASFFRLEKMLPAAGQTEPKFMMRYSSNTTTLNSGDVVIDFNNNYHTSGDFVTYEGTRFVAQVPGVYRLYSHLTHQGDEARFTPYVRFRKNGSTFTGAMGGMGYSRNASGHTYADVLAEDFVFLNPGEYIECYSDDLDAGIGSGTMRLNNAFSNSSFFLIEYISPYPGITGA